MRLDAHAPCIAAFESTLRNPLARPIRFQATAGPGVDVQPSGSVELPPGQQATLRLARKVARTEPAAVVSSSLAIESLGRVTQTLQLSIDNPLRVVPLPAAGAAAAIRLENPSGEPFHGFASLTDVEGLSPAAAKTELRLAAGETEKIVLLPLAGPAGAKYRYGVLLEEEGRTAQAVPPRRWTAVDDFARYSAQTLAAAYRLVPDGDRKVSSEQTMMPAPPPAGLPGSAANCLKITYRFDQGWKFVGLRPKTDALRRVEGRPRSVGMWIHCDGTGNTLRLRVVDATGQTLQPDGEVMRGKGWRYITFSLDGTHAGHWGGANDGMFHYPLRWDSLLLIDSSHQKKTEGVIYVGMPTFIE